jgi:hypothetical protein
MLEGNAGLWMCSYLKKHGNHKGALKGAIPRWRDRVRMALPTMHSVAEVTATAFG